MYLISCKLCGAEHGWGAGESLYVRIKEHLVGKSKVKENTLLGTPKAQRHNREDCEIKVTLLAQESEFISAYKC